MTQSPPIASPGGRAAPSRGADNGDSTKPSADSSFRRLIADDGKPAAADPSKGKPSDGKASDKPAKDDAQTSAAGDNATTVGQADGSAVLAWLQQSGSPAQATNPAATEVAVQAGDAAKAVTSGQGGGVNVLARLGQPLVPGAAKRTAASGDADDDGGRMELPIFRLPDSPSASAGGKSAAASTLESLLAGRDEAAAAVLAAKGGADSLPAASQAASFAALTAAATGATTGGLAHVDLSQTAGAALNAALQTPLSANSPDLPQHLGERVQWMVGSGTQEARLQLHPADLGLVNVQVKIEGGNASVFFSAEHPAARAAIQAALPQLREQFSGSGMQLAQAQVSSQSSGDAWTFGNSQGSGRGGSGGSGFGAAGGGEGEGEVSAVSAPRIVHVGLVDHYA